MSIRRPDDKRMLKYWLPYGLMRRHLARSYGMVVRGGQIVKGSLGPSDTALFRLVDILPLWAVMFLQRARGDVSSTGTSDESTDLKTRVRQLAKSLSDEQQRRREETDSLKVENLRLKLFAQDVAKAAGMAGGVSSTSIAAPPSPGVKTAIAGLTSLYRKPAAAAWNNWRLMDAAPLKVDMICSIGGDCIAASQQKLRGLRPYALPFDWCFSDGAEAVRNFACQLECGFSGFALRPNLVPIPGVKFGYKDRATGYNFMHHFHAPLDTAGEYERFREVLTRRINRLYSEIERSETILFLLSRTFKMEEGCLDAVEDVCRRKWPQKKFFFAMATYNSLPSGVWTTDSRIVVRIPRDRNAYDMKEKVFEWSFLDNVSLK